MTGQELTYSAFASLSMPESDRYGRTHRVVMPLFADCDRRFNQFELRILYLASLQAEHIDYAGWPSAIGPLVDRMAVKLKLKKRPDKDDYPKPDLAKARTQLLADTELAATLSYDDYEGWYVDNFGDAEARYLAKTFKFRGFSQALDFVVLVADHCKVLDHHPEWRNVFDHVTVALTTWDAPEQLQPFLDLVL